MRFWLVAIGCSSMLGQVVLLREVSVAFFGVELVLVLALGVWMMGTAQGALLVHGGARPARERDVRATFAIFGLLLVGAAVGLRGCRRLFHAVPGAYLGLGTQLLVLGVVLLPVAATLGVLFVRSARCYAAGGGTLARAYALESAGGLLGGLASTLLLAAGVQNFVALLLCSGLAIVSALLPRGRPTAAQLAGIALLGSVLLAAAGFGARLDRATTRWNHPQLVASRDTPYARVTLTEASGQLVVYEDDALATESQSTAAEAFVHVAAVQRDSLPAVLALGGFVPGLLPEILAHRPRRVDDFEPDAALFDLVRAHAPGSLVQASTDPRVHVRFGDPRRLLHDAAAYDLVLVGMPEPESGRANRYYTREFFAQVARHLTPQGVLALRLRGAENLWTPQLLERLASVRAALQVVFPAVVVLPGSTCLLLASPAPLATDPGVPSARLQARALAARFMTPAHLRYLYSNDRFADLEARLQSTVAPINSDLRPSCYQTTMLLWLARFFPRLARIEGPGVDAGAALRSPRVWAMLALLACALALARRGRVARAAAFAALAGASGMILESVLLLRYQSETGVLYQDLGLLLTAFMLGLAVGAEIVHRRTAGRPAPAALGVGAAWGLSGVALVVALTLRLPAAAGLLAIAVLQACAGSAVGAAFAATTVRARLDARTLVSTVYAADLLGGAAATLLVALWFAPALGLGGAAAAAAVLGGLAFFCC